MSLSDFGWLIPKVASWCRTTDGDRTLRVLGVVCALVVVDCQSRQAAAPKLPATTCSSAESASGRAPASTNPKASITFVENGADILEWNFLVRGLPAVDLQSGAVVIADLSHGSLASSLGLSLLWLRPDEQRPFRQWWVLDESTASTILYERDGDPKLTAPLAEKVRVQTHDANQMLATLALRPTTPCNVQKAPDWCVHPQRLVCGELSADLQGHALEWSLGAKTRGTNMGWRAEPIVLDNNPKEALTCIDEAYFDPNTRLLIARTTGFCKERGGDACIMSNGWRTVTLHE